MDPQMNPEQSTVAPHTFSTMVGLLEGQRKERKADRAVQGLVFLKFLLQLCAALKPSCRPEESEGFVQSLWQLPATCGRITRGDMPNCKVARVNPKPFNLWFIQGYGICGCLTSSASVCAEPNLAGQEFST